MDVTGASIWRRSGGEGGGGGCGSAESASNDKALADPASNDFSSRAGGRSTFHIRRVLTGSPTSALANIFVDHGHHARAYRYKPRQISREWLDKGQKLRTLTGAECWMRLRIVRWLCSPSSNSPKSRAVSRARVSHTYTRPDSSPLANSFPSSFHVRLRTVEWCAMTLFALPARIFPCFFGSIRVS